MSRRMPIPSSPGDWAALHVAVVIPSFGLDRRELGHPRVVGSEVAHRIGCARIARERKGLAAAAAEIELTTWAAHGSLIHPVPRKALKAGEFAQISASDRSRTFQNSSPVIDSAAWQGSTLPAGVTLSERRPQPPTQGFGYRA